MLDNSVEPSSCDPRHRPNGWIYFSVERVVRAVFVDYKIIRRSIKVIDSLRGLRFE